MSKTVTLKNGFDTFQQRVFSTEFKKKIVAQIEKNQMTISQASKEYQVSRSAVYKWFYKYTLKSNKGILVVQMESEEQRSLELKQKIALLEQVIGQKQLELDFLNKLMELGSKELGFDFKKNFSSQLLNGTEPKKP